jgi:hypothetical protein
VIANSGKTKNLSPQKFKEHIEMREEGLRLLDEVLYSSNLLQNNLQLATECYFYAIIYGNFEKYNEYFQWLKIALKRGGRARGWDMSFHVDYSKRSKHPDMAWIPTLVSVINGKASHVTYTMGQVDEMFYKS